MYRTIHVCTVIGQKLSKNKKKKRKKMASMLTTASSTTEESYTRRLSHFTGFLSVGRPELNHQIYYECSGNPEGIPVLVSHGGPGGGVQDYYRQYFDKDIWHIIMFDQRGAGKSTPWASLDDNTTWHTVSDMEEIRTKLNIEKWALFGGSWGACISLSYAQTHPTRCLGLVPRNFYFATL